MRLKPSVLLVLLLLFPAACMIFDDRCGPLIRETTLAGEIRDTTGALLGSATFVLREAQGDPMPLVLQVIVMGVGVGSRGGPLRGHVRAARLVAASDGAVLYDLPTTAGPADQVLASPFPLMPDPVNFEALRHQFLARNVAFVLETDLPGLAELRVPLPTLYAGTWDRAHCS